MRDPETFESRLATAYRRYADEVRAEVDPMALARDILARPARMPLPWVALVARASLGVAAAVTVVAVLGVGLIPRGDIRSGEALVPSPPPRVGSSAVASPGTAPPGTVHGWPGAENVPAGLYSWPVTPGSTRWMHKVPPSFTDAAPNSVELRFSAALPDDDPGPLGGSMVMRGEWRDADGPFDRPTLVADQYTELWLLDVEGTRVAIQLASFPDTDPALVAEAHAVVDSIVIEPTTSGRRLVFRLPEGWDSG